MNKHFFKINHRIKLLDILNFLEISQDYFFSQQSNTRFSLESIYVQDFVSFENLKKNKLSFFTNTKKNIQNITSGICIVEKKKF